jgi:hypothetical protein
MVDGDLLLLLTEKELEEDVGMKSNLLRKRFMRELESLKVYPHQTEFFIIKQFRLLLITVVLMKANWINS